MSSNTDYVVAGENPGSKRERATELGMPYSTKINYWLCSTSNPPSPMLTTLDYVVIVLYLAGVAAFGIKAGGRQKSTADYFLGNRDLPWWAVCFSVVATETSR